MDGDAGCGVAVLRCYGVTVLGIDLRSEIGWRRGWDSLNRTATFEFEYEKLTLRLEIRDKAAP